MVRKKGKLPGQVISANYVKEYGTDTFEMQSELANLEGKNVLIVDDLLATGGSFACAIELLKQFDTNILGCFALLQVDELKNVAQQTLGQTQIGILLP